ncbi:hypothetical protein JS532_01230 [Bifidobacterium callimiconis]|uniref:tripartite tricarboxylate transporter TctB family protein n=1 Tax=Bifidobacterium callimiconis TaxID=2306973 RepID=UPI001BDC4A28|nr:tripartite tricarboxylate transporter TctB family protein [Bifidobacterium callimiconis]MBT1176191.1 hypothetical protein [Bifidobacterium callimiconis]
MTDETRNPKAEPQAATTGSGKERTDMSITTATNTVMPNAAAGDSETMPSDTASGIDTLGALDALNSLHELNSDRDRMAKRSEHGMRAMCIHLSLLYIPGVLAYWSIGLMFGGRFVSDIAYIVTMTALVLIVLSPLLLIARYRKTTGMPAFATNSAKRVAFRDRRFFAAYLTSIIAQLLLPWTGFAWGFIGGNWIGAVVLAVLTALAIYGLERWHIREWTRVSRLPVAPEEDPHAR